MTKKRLSKPKKVFAALIAAGSAAVVTGVFFLSVFLATLGEIKTVIDTRITYQEIGGFGGSAAWYYQSLGLAAEDVQDEALEMLYGDSGMRLNVFRYNVGAGSSDKRNVYEYQNEACHTESFFVPQLYAGADSFSNPDNYDFTKDGAAVSLMKKAVELNNIDKLVFFANSPHYLLTKSGLAHGAVEKDNNLPAENYGAFADYLLIISHNLYGLIGAADRGIDLYISPVNEPQWKWGGENAAQEGCHFDPDELAAFMQVFYDKLTQFNLQHGTSYKMDAFESGSYKLKSIRQYLKAAAEYEWFKQANEISVHSYHGAEDNRVKTRFYNYLTENYGQKTVIMSEFCQMEEGRDTSVESGLYAARVALKDLVYLNASEWGWWLTVAGEDYNSGLVYYDSDAEGSRLSVLKRYYTLSHFTRFLDKGDKRVHLNIKDIAGMAGIEGAAFVSPTGELKIIFINSGKRAISLKLNIELNKAAVYTTTADKNLALSKFSGSSVYVPALSVTTVVVSTE